MRKKQLMRTMLFMTVLAFMLYGFGLPAQAASPKKGGVLKVAMKGQPPSLDMQYSTSNVIRNVALHINEGLFSFDKDYKPLPMLAESFTISDDGLVHTYKLREGVKFHNGQEMTSADVVASINRFLKKSTFGKRLAKFTDKVSAKGKYTVELVLKKSVNFVEMALATYRAGAMIYPESTIKNAGDKLITDYIGTGPYRFVDWKEGQEIILERFEDYQPLNQEANGYGGKKMAYFDQIKFIFVPEDSVRRVGVETGDFHVALDVSRDSYKSYQNNADIQSIIGAPRMATIVMNKANGPTANLMVRKAIQAAICVEEILPIYGDKRFWRADPSINWKETAWWTDVGKEFYNVCDQERAKEYVKISGYDGAPIRIALSSSDQSKNELGLVVEQQLEAVGLNVELLVRDHAGYEKILDDSARNSWEFDPCHHTYRTHPFLHSHLSSTWEGWWDNPEKEKLVDEMLQAKNFEKAFEIWKDIQRLYYEDVPLVKIGDFFEYHIAGDKLKGYANLPEPFFWNVWLEQ